MMQYNDLKNSKSKDKGSRSRSQSMNDQVYYKQDKTKTRQIINVKSHIFNVRGDNDKSKQTPTRMSSVISKRKNLLSEEVLNSLSALIYYRALDTITLRELIESEGRLIPEVPEPGVPRVSIPIPPRASMKDLHERIGRIKIRQGAIERMYYRQSYHWDRYAGVFKHMAGVYSVPLQGAYNPPGYDQQQYD
ncbi:hypothetical protein Tco_0180481 [Tanacetum coccineum]